jgi:hypothetical protein
MPSVVASIPFTVPPVMTGEAFCAFQDAEAMGTFSRVECSISVGALPLLAPGAGTATSLTSIGLNAGVAPPLTANLQVIASGTAFESALVIAEFSMAGAQAQVRLFVEEFLPSGAFSTAMTQAPVSIYDDNEFFLGVNARVNQLGNFTLNQTFPITPGRFYRVWFDSLQNAYCSPGGAPQAVSNFAYDLGPVSFRFF